MTKILTGHHDISLFSATLAYISIAVDRSAEVRRQAAIVAPRHPTLIDFKLARALDFGGFEELASLADGAQEEAFAEDLLARLLVVGRGGAARFAA